MNFTKIAFVFLLVFTVGPFAKAAVPVTVSGTVKRVVDGDTVHAILADGSVMKVRMHQIDAPEWHLPLETGGVVGQAPYGELAGVYLQKLLPPGTQIKILDRGLDKYQRTVGTIYFKGQDMNYLMVAAGMAAPYVYCVEKDCDAQFFKRNKVAEFLAACENAVTKGLGMFAKPRPLFEMGYEFRHRISGKVSSSLIGNFSNHQLFNPVDLHKVPICQRVFFLNPEDAKRVGYQ